MRILQDIFIACALLVVIMTVLLLQTQRRNGIVLMYQPPPSSTKWVRLRPGITCSLLTEGYYTGRKYSSIFHTKACTLHNYTKRDTADCMTSGPRSIAFAGDSRVRRLYIYFTRFIDLKRRKWPVLPNTANRSFYFDDLNLTTSFTWMPLVPRNVKKWLNISSISTPDILLLGIGVHYIIQPNGTKDGPSKFANDLKEAMKNLTDFVSVLWLLQDPVNEQIPMSRRHDEINNARVDVYNAIAKDILNTSHVNWWATSRVTGEQFTDSFDDRVHIKSKLVDKHKIQIFLNWLCNEHMNFQDGTCCRKPR